MKGLLPLGDVSQSLTIQRTALKSQLDGHYDIATQMTPAKSVADAILQGSKSTKTLNAPKLSEGITGHQVAEPAILSSARQADAKSQFDTRSSK